MIQQLRTHLETTLGIPVHFVLVTEKETFPCATIRLKSATHVQEMTRASTSRISTVELTIYDHTYASLDTYGETMIAAIDGQGLALADGDCRIAVADEDDSATPSPFGNDEFLFLRTYELSVHQKRN